MSAALIIYGDRLCQDPRDKIYGLLGICHFIFPHMISIDYRFLVGQVYHMAARSFILEELDLNSIFHGPRFCTSELASEYEKKIVPSWVPDFSRYADFEVLIGHHYETIWYFDGVGGWSEDMVYNTFHKDNEKVLNLVSVIFSPVSSLGARVDLGSENWQQIVRQWEPRNLRDGQFEDYWRTLLLDLSCESGRITQADIDLLGLSFLSWRKFSIEDNVPRKRSYAINDSSDSNASPLGNAFATELEKRIKGRVFAQLENEYFAMVPEYSEKGDYIAMVHGSRLPVILRRVSREETASIKGIAGELAWKFIGTAYVHGIMNGEVWEDVKKGLLEEEAMFLI